MKRYLITFNPSTLLFDMCMILLNFSKFFLMMVFSFRKVWSFFVCMCKFLFLSSSASCEY